MKLEELNHNYVMTGVLGFFILLMLFAIFISPNYKYVICQYEQCYRADTYTKTPTGLNFTYDNKKMILEGPYIIKEI